MSARNLLVAAIVLTLVFVLSVSAAATGEQPSPVLGTSGITPLDAMMSQGAPPDETDAALPGNVLQGKTYRSVIQDERRLQTGTMPNNGSVLIQPATVDQPIAQGYHDGAGYVQGDPDLVASNIRQGVDLFGVVGEYSLPTNYAPVPRTGQTKTYWSGDDGDLRMGVRWPDPRFTDNGDGTVTDNLTGLMWAQDASLSGTRIWEWSVQWCNDLALAGYTDWRMPSIRELFSLVNFSITQPPLAQDHPFSGVQRTDYWSSTTLNMTSAAWVVHFDYGLVKWRNKADQTLVWPVRGGQ